jgi:four helix bundle protein
MFDFENLDVYRAAIEWIALADEVASHLPRGRSYLSEQLQRAATSVVLNIAEGAGEYSGSEKARFYRMATRSATECAAILDVCRQLHLIEEARYTVAVSSWCGSYRCWSKWSGASAIRARAPGTGTGTK